MSEKLTWDEIKRQFADEWVQLIDFDWDMTEPEPQAGVVRVHSKNRKEFHRLLKIDPVNSSAILYAGDPFPRDPNIIFNFCKFPVSGVR